MMRIHQIVAGAVVSAFFLSGHLCTAPLANAQGLADTGRHARTPRASSRGEPISPSPDAICLMISRDSDTSGDNRWAEDPAEMYVPAKSRYEKSSYTPGKAATEVEARAADAPRGSHQGAVVAERTAATASPSRADRATPWLVIGIPLVVGGVAFALIGWLAFFVQNRRSRRTVPQVALLNMVVGNGKEPQRSATIGPTAAAPRRAA